MHLFDLDTVDESIIHDGIQFNKEDIRKNLTLFLYPDDSDEAGQKAALRGIPILKAAGIRPRVVNLTPYKDPDEFIKAEGRETFEKRLEEQKMRFCLKYGF